MTNFKITTKANNIIHVYCQVSICDILVTKTKTLIKTKMNESQEG